MAASAIFTPSLETPVLCITNHPKTLWLKTTNMYLGHRSDFYAELHKKAYLCSTRHQLGRLDWMPKGLIPRWLSPRPAGWCWLLAGSLAQPKTAGLGSSPHGTLNMGPSGFPTSWYLSSKNEGLNRTTQSWISNLGLLQEVT